MHQIQTSKQGTSVLCSSLPKIKEIKPETLKAIFPEKAKKAVNKMDVFMFRQYMLALKNNTRVTQDEIKELFSFDGEEFESKAYQFLIKKLNIPENIMPAYRSVPAIVGNASAAYSWFQNCIYINQQNTIPDKATYLSLLRHELQHYLQNMQVIRSEKTGEKAVKLYAQELNKSEIQNCDYIAKNLTLEQIQQAGVSEEGMVIYKELKTLLDEGKTKEYEEKLEQLRQSGYNQIFAQWSEIRKNAIAEMGVIKEGTKEWKRAEKFFDDIHSSYFTQDNKIDYGKYVFQCIENDAIVAQAMMLLNAKGEKFCYPQELKKEKAELSVSEDSQAVDVKESINKYAEELKTKSVFFKDIMSYLFD